jgi:uncharacterized membrane protein YfcA
MIIRAVLLAVLVMTGIAFISAWRRAVNIRQDTARWPSSIQLVIGFVTDFFDTLGIGSFATTTAAYKLSNIVRDEKLVGTMIVGHSLPVVAQALIFIAAVKVDPIALGSLIAASVLGGWVGAGICSRLPVRPIQITISIGLIAAATFMMMSQLGVFPTGGTALTLPVGKLMFALAVNFILGILLMLGIGNYAPSLIIFSLLGMDPRAAFPIMMGSGALMAMAGGFRFIQAAKFDRRAALGLTLGGIPGVLVAGLIVKSLPLSVLRWMVVAVVIYAATMMLRSATKRPKPSLLLEPEPVPVL